MFIITDADTSRAAARVISGVCNLVCVCVSVRAFKEKRLGLSTPNLVHIYFIAGPRRAFTQRSKGQRQGHTVTKNRQGRMAASGCCRRCAARAGVQLHVVYMTAYRCLVVCIVDVMAVVVRGGMVQTNEQYEFVHHALSMFDQRRYRISRSSSPDTSSSGSTDSASFNSSSTPTHDDDDDDDLCDLK